MSALFDDWTQNRPLPWFGTNSGTGPVAFQTWHRFKEAFPPELIRRAVGESGDSVTECFDPFGGSGTTALACQFLGVASTTVEVNPFLVDVIKAKLARYDADSLAQSFGMVRREASRTRPDPARYFGALPTTFVQPGSDGRWLFASEVAQRIAALRVAITTLKDDAHRRFFSVLLGGILVEVSNATVNGKGRRYRRNWEKRIVNPQQVDRLFAQRCQLAIGEVHRYSGRPRARTSVIRGDARRVQPRRTHDIAIFSPPYPNSFDYTDVYNIELWMLGYLSNSYDNHRLRGATLSSHVQLHRKYARAPVGSPTLQISQDRLEAVKDRLWSPWIPSMVGAYFADLGTVLRRVGRVIRRNGLCWIVVGDSRYGGVFVPSGRILAELAPTFGWAVESTDPFRAMRSSAQHGGTNELPETLIVLRKMDEPKSCP